MFASRSHAGPRMRLNPASPLTDSNRRPLPYHEGGRTSEIPVLIGNDRDHDVAPGGSTEGSRGLIVRTSFARTGAREPTLDHHLQGGPLDGRVLQGQAGAPMHLQLDAERYVLTHVMDPVAVYEHRPSPSTTLAALSRALRPGVRS